MVLRFYQGSRHSPWPTRARLGIGPLLTEGRTEMRCLECGSEAVTERPERSVTLLNRTQYPSDVVALVVLWRLRYKLARRDLPEMFTVRGIVFSYEAVREWEPASSRRRAAARRWSRRSWATVAPTFGFPTGLPPRWDGRGWTIRSASLTSSAMFNMQLMLVTRPLLRA